MEHKDLEKSQCHQYFQILMSLLDHMMSRLVTGLIYLAKIYKKETIIRLINCRYAKKALINWKKLDSTDTAKYNFDGKTKIFIT